MKGWLVSYYDELIAVFLDEDEAERYAFECLGTEAGIIEEVDLEDQSTYFNLRH